VSAGRVSEVIICMRCRLRNRSPVASYSRSNSGINPIRRRISVGKMSSELISTNIEWLRQALSLVDQLDDERYGLSPQRLAPHRVGSHLRHVLDFYDCFLNGLASAHVDYDARERDETIENDRHAAMKKIGAIVERLQNISVGERDSVMFVRAEDTSDVFLRSTVSRELQALSTHTIHHFALIAFTLKVDGFPVDPAFGMSPSTLRFHAERAAA
jgi:hypothetical protein